MMYESAKALARFGYHQARNIAKLFLGYPLTTPSLGSVTLDHDDLLIAKTQLKNRKTH